jgi:hypothetical protein
MHKGSAGSGLAEYGLFFLEEESLDGQTGYSLTPVYDLIKFITEEYLNGTARFKKCTQLFEYQPLLLLRDIW